MVIVGDAQQKADTLRGEGDAQRNKTFADAYGRDPDFFAFYRLMGAYNDALANPRTRLVLTPGTANEFFRFFKSPSGAATVTPPKSAGGSTGTTVCRAVRVRVSRVVLDIMRPEKHPIHPADLVLGEIERLFPRGRERVPFRS